MGGVPYGEEAENSSKALLRDLPRVASKFPAEASNRGPSGGSFFKLERIRFVSHVSTFRPSVRGDNGTNAELKCTDP